MEVHFNLLTDHFPLHEKIQRTPSFRGKTPRTGVSSPLSGPIRHLGENWPAALSPSPRAKATRRTQTAHHNRSCPAAKEKNPQTVWPARRAQVRPAGIPRFLACFWENPGLMGGKRERLQLPMRPVEGARTFVGVRLLTPCVPRRALDWLRLSNLSRELIFLF